jgi:hypothetical protein
MKKIYVMKICLTDRVVTSMTVVLAINSLTEDPSIIQQSTIKP